MTWSSTIAAWSGRGHRADVLLGGLPVGPLAQRAHLLDQFRDELVVDGLLDVDPLDREADLAGVVHPAPGRGVGGPVEVGVGEDDHRILAAELEADRGQGLGGACHHLAAGSVGACELDEVDLVDQGATGLAAAMHAVEDVGGADLLLPRLDDLGQAQRRELGGLDDYCGPGLQGRDRVAHRQGEREVPGADHADHRVGAVEDAELLRGEQRRVRPDVFLGEKLRRPAAVEVDQVGQVDALDRGVGADLAGLRLHRVGDALGVVEQPVAQLAEPVVAALDPHRLPVGLVGTHPGHGRGDPLRSVGADRCDRLAGGGVENLDPLLGRDHGAVRCLGRPCARRRSAALHQGAPFLDPVWLVSQE